MKRITITTFTELERAKKRIDSIEGEVWDHQDEIHDLQDEQEHLEKEISRFEKAIKVTEESASQKLWKHVQNCWHRFTWTEQRIAERAAMGDELDRQEEARFKLLCMQELHIVEGGAK